MTEDNTGNSNKNNNTNPEITEDDWSDLENEILSETSGGTGGGSNHNNPNIGCGE
ncbi:hypothetical protein SG34_013800 [Thalassomonas viridans]|uniref:Uncharacterized protein n=1 Tax=Thalassomonas viridans TaxID=137584 RepID=A0AAF0C9T5_9GAMM|nr:hypothetical protein [Thalassomonas viridans]WDE07857.1 hypothetical protein SG34_013800 [Thalassomonas viridans]